jgi:hypothetical protein
VSLSRYCADSVRIRSDYIEKNALLDATGRFLARQDLPLGLPDGIGCLEAIEQRLLDGHPG